MATENWQWANLTPEQLIFLDEAEQTLGADYLLVYQQGESPKTNGNELMSTELPVAQLNESQLECLHGLETRLDAVVVAYQK